LIGCFLLVNKEGFENNLLDASVYMNYVYVQCCSFIDPMIHREEAMRCCCCCCCVQPGNPEKGRECNNHMEMSDQSRERSWNARGIYIYVYI